MLKKEEAREKLQEHYDSWKKIGDNALKDGGLGNKFIWFGYVQKERPDLLKFRHSAKDIWQTINVIIK